MPKVPGLWRSLFIEQATISFHKCPEGRGIIWMPARKSGPILDDVACSPQYPALINRPRHIVVWAQYIEISRRQTLHHEINRLLRSPCASWLLGAAFAGKPCEDKAGNEQVCAEMATCGVS